MWPLTTPDWIVYWSLMCYITLCSPSTLCVLCCLDRLGCLQRLALFPASSLGMWVSPWPAYISYTYNICTVCAFCLPLLPCSPSWTVMKMLLCWFFVLFLCLDLLHFVSTVNFRMDTATVCKHWRNSCFVVVIISVILIMIISKAQILKKSSALYKEYDGRPELVNVHVQKSNNANIKHNIYWVTPSLSLSVTHTLLLSYGLLIYLPS